MNKVVQIIAVLCISSLLFGCGSANSDNREQSVTESESQATVLESNTTPTETTAPNQTNGLVQEEDGIYIVVDGEYQTGWYELEPRIFYYLDPDENGRAVAGWNSIGNL